MKLTVSVSAVAAVLGLTAISSAQPTPKFEYGKADELKDVKETEWTATAEAGLVFTTGNSRTTTLSGALKAMRKQAKNKLSIEATGTFAQAETLKPKVPGDTVLSAGDVDRESKTSAQAYNAKLRYDRFLSEFNSIYLAALGGADVIAGKDFVGGGQLGYSRLVYKTERHEVAGELGYDFSYESFVDPTADSISIHSARGFAGYKGKLSETTSVDGSVELLANVNEQSDTVGPGEDLRGTGVVSLSTKLTKSVSLAFSLTAKYDNVPAPFSLAGYTIDAANPPEALKLDTTTKASLIINLL
jgi:Protein of unknown function, DUF481